MKSIKSLIFIFTIIGNSLTAQDVTITSEKISDHVYVLYGGGGNIGLAVTDNGVYMIDDQFAELTPKILAEIKTITDQPVKYLINSHWHGDHTGGNENMAKQGAVIVAHDNVFKRMSVKQDQGGGRVQEAVPDMALPQITYSDNMTMHLDRNTEIMIMHVHKAHTDTDSFIYFPFENVIHMGDVFFNGRYPFIDINSGGSINGVIEGLDHALFIVNDDTKIIPGHGKVTDKGILKNYREMLVTIRERVRKAKDDGKTLEETQAMSLTSEYNVKHSNDSNSLVGYIYNSLE
ncbi:MBL fold metallo-hydrolase [Galbibacter pacificus]|uniref:beta-lactamase n=1 Tax=Galbibacter pacificus TaxID=2996052 RepID=A0ABT6FRG6_9FLAO|nr:MBL fold metallo-hydrolase [Galbibacter pacificus]MDG3581830.1 MBL fold metallo-hydrolase [Galbibacter pacificus]MDG3585696.1 MBL fold metallo-hydrolase [Galbibacter pacificus]